MWGEQRDQAGAAAWSRWRMAGEQLGAPVVSETP